MLKVLDPDLPSMYIKPVVPVILVMVDVVQVGEAFVSSHNS